MASNHVPDSEHQNYECDVPFFDHPAFLPREKYNDASSLLLRYPNSVVIVTSEAVKNFPPFPGEVARFHGRLDLALESLVEKANEAETEEVQAYSIIVNEGVYGLSNYNFPASLSLEIVGMGKVVFIPRAFVGMGKVVFIPAPQSLKFNATSFFMTNVAILDSPGSKAAGIISVSDKSHVHFTDVRFIVPYPGRFTFYIRGKGSKVVLSHCLMDDMNDGEAKVTGFKIEDGATMAINDCHFRNVTYVIGAICKSSSLLASGTTFENCGQLMLTDSSTAVIQKCKFEGKVSDQVPALVVESQSKLLVRDCEIKGYSGAVSVKKQSEADIANSYLACHTASEVQNSSKLKLSDNQIFCRDLLHVLLNEEGQIILKGNQMMSDVQPVFRMDQELPKSSLSHDYSESSVQIELYDREAALAQLYRNRKEISRDSVDRYCHRTCARCKVPEIRSDESGAVVHAKEKYKHCGYCKSVRYCSKKCQKDDWPHHKKECRIMFERKKRGNAT